MFAAGSLLQEGPTSRAEFVTVVEERIDFVCRTLGVGINTAGLRAPDFFLLSLHWLKQLNMHFFLENNVEKIVWAPKCVTQINEVGNGALSK